MMTTPVLDDLPSPDTQSLNSAYETYRSRRDERFALQRLAKRVSASTGIRACLSRSTGAVVRARCATNEEGRPIAGFSDVWRCGLAAICPVCAPKVRDTLADEINTSVGAFLRAGGHAAFIVLTIASVPDESIEDATAAVERCYSEFRRRLRTRGHLTALSIVGDIAGWEWTVRLDGSGHPHRQALVLAEKPTTAMAFVRAVAWSWHDAVHACGRSCTYSAGVRVETPQLDVDGGIRVLAAYMSKGAEHWGAGDELTRADRKTSRSSTSFAPFDLLRLVRDGEATEQRAAAAAWRAYERASKAKAVGRFSRGLRAYLALVAATGGLPTAATADGETEAADRESEAEAIAQEVSLVDEVRIESPVVVEFDPIAWGFVVRRHLHSLVLRLIEDAHQLGDHVGLVRYAFEDLGAAQPEIDGVRPPRVNEDVTESQNHEVPKELKDLLDGKAGRRPRLV